MDWIVPDRLVDAPAGMHGLPNERDVFLFDLAVVELPCELVM